MLNEIKQYITMYVESNKAEYLEMAREVWEKPELGMEEFFASGMYASHLEKNGFKVERNAAGMPTAFIATYGEEGPVIGFSMEYDALPGLSQKVQTKKEPVVPGAPGQGCGHNLIGTGGALAAVAFKSAMERFGLKAQIRIFGTPAEELCIGKPVMGNAGLFQGVDVFIDWHPWFESSGNYKNCPAYFNVKYHYKGRTAHGNSPWHGRSALDAAILQAHAIEMLREHIEPSPDPAAAHTINFTFSDTGPEFASVVPDRATLWCIGRFTESTQLVEILKRLEGTAKGSALATGTTVEIEYITACHEMLTNEVIAKLLYDNLREFGDVEYTEEEKQFVMEMQENEGQEPFWVDEISPYGQEYSAVTDASEYSWEAPYSQLMLRLGPGPGWHNWMVCACNGSTHGQKALLKAAEILAGAAVDLVQKPEIIEAAKAEWRKKRGGREYRSLLPEGTPIPLDVNKETMKKYRTW